MIRERMQQLKAALTARVNTVREAVDEVAVDSLDAEVAELVNEIAEVAGTIELNEEEQGQIFRAYNTKDPQVLQEALFTVQNEFRVRFFNTTLAPVMQRIYRLRLLAVFLDRSTYNNYVMKTASLFEAFSNLTAQLSIGLLKAEIEKLNAAFTEAEKARTEYSTFGPTIEE